MSDRHLSTGSTDVPPTPGKLRLYSMRFCPYAQRTHLVLDAKQIPYDTVWINLMQKPEWYLEKYPRGLVPALDVNGEALTESLIICDYLDEAYPEKNPLHSKVPLRKAQDRIIVELFSKISPSYYKAVTQELTEELFEDCLRALDPIEKELKARGTKFFLGDQPGMPDYMIWPWMERFGLFQVRKGDAFALPKDRLSRLVAWTEAMKSDPAVKKSYISPEKHEEFMKIRKSGDVNCFDAVKL